MYLVTGSVTVKEDLFSGSPARGALQPFVSPEPLLT